MHYVVDGLLIKSENAARTVSQQSKFVMNWIDKLPSNFSVLDYGCGKLRYTIPLSKKVNQVTAVDSEIQINRLQSIDSEMTTVKKYVENRLVNTKVCSIISEEWQESTYDAIICTNVLSAIPDEQERIKVLQNIYRVLKKNGHALIVNQHRNSYFKTYNQNQNSKQYFDGWIIQNSRGNSFYGLIPTSKLKEYLSIVGFDIIECKTEGESAYAIIKV